MIFFLLLGVACASDVGNVSSVENSNDNSDLLSSNANFEKELTDGMLAKESAGANDTSELGANYENSDDVSNSSDVLGAKNTNNPKTAVIKVNSSSTLIKNEYFTLKVSEKNGKAVAGKKVAITINGKTYERTTNKNGFASLKMAFPQDYYVASYSFTEKGYTPVKGKANVLIVNNPSTALEGSNYVAYKGFVNYYKVKLTSNGLNLKSKKLKFVIDGKTYYKTTNSHGNAYLPINLPVGRYAIKYYFEGGNNLNPAGGKSLVAVKKGMPTKITRANNIYYFTKTSAPFKVKVLDARGNPVPGKVVFSIDGKKHTKPINAKGVATINLKLSQGTHKINYAFYKTSKYNKCSGSKSIYVRSSKTVNNGFWLFGRDMKKVSLNSLAECGTRHIFLNYYALKWHGKNAVEAFIKNARAKGIRVHLWMQIFYNGDWISPVNSDGSYKYSLFKAKINEARKYAALKGISGVHLDYLRFPGTAYNHANGVAAINYFTKLMCAALHKMNPKIIVSAAVMPEYDSNKYFYGQDIPTISKYLDVIIPMIYKGNYGAGTSWIKSTTAAFVKQSHGAKIWTGLQSYRSDEDATKLPAAELLKDARAASYGGATGVIMFRYGLSNLINFCNI